MKKIPYYLQGFLFAPAFIGLEFVLKVTCPASTGQGCFVDSFLGTTFMPLTFLYEVLAPYASVVARHEPLFILGYWAVIGFLVGLCADILIVEENPQEEREALF